MARSPQAKGRVERNHGVYQDRFVKELRLEDISEIKAANQYLETTYLNQVNAKFAKPPIDDQDAHVPLLQDRSLESIFCFEEKRVVSEDYVLRHERRLFQIQREKRRRPPAPQTSITVQKWLDDSVHFLHNDKELLVEEILPKPKNQEEQALSA